MYVFSHAVIIIIMTVLSVHILSFIIIITSVLCVYVFIIRCANRKSRGHDVTFGWLSVCMYVLNIWMCYGVATTSRLLKFIGPLCRIQSLLQDSFAKETYNFKEPTSRSHPICIKCMDVLLYCDIMPRIKVADMKLLWVGFQSACMC